MLDMTIEQIFCLGAVVIAIIYRIFAFNKIKKKNATKEGREYIASKGGKIILLLEGRIVLMVIIFAVASILKLGLIPIILLIGIGYLGTILLEYKIRK